MTPKIIGLHNCKNRVAINWDEEDGIGSWSVFSLGGGGGINLVFIVYIVYSYIVDIGNI